MYRCHTCEYPCFDNELSTWYEQGNVVESCTWCVEVWRATWQTSDTDKKRNKRKEKWARHVEIRKQAMMRVDCYRASMECLVLSQTWSQRALFSVPVRDRSWLAPDDGAYLVDHTIYRLDSPLVTIDYFHGGLKCGVCCQLVDGPEIVCMPDELVGINGNFARAISKLQMWFRLRRNVRKAVRILLRYMPAGATMSAFTTVRGEGPQRRRIACVYTTATC